MAWLARRNKAKGKRRGMMSGPDKGETIPDAAQGLHGLSRWTSAGLVVCEVRLKGLDSVVSCLGRNR
jgi:hypothetical protein